MRAFRQHASITRIVKFKIDENLPVELAGELSLAGHEAVTAGDQQLVGSHDFDLSEICKPEGRVLVTVDLDFAVIRTYPPENYSGLVILRLARQDKSYVLSVFGKMLGAVDREPLEGRLWIVEENRIRI
jgi:predicted nuclease of predicted toxin-antitoxin system